MPIVWVRSCGEAFKECSFGISFSLFYFFSYEHFEVHRFTMWNLRLRTTFAPLSVSLTYLWKEMGHNPLGCNVLGPPLSKYSPIATSFIDDRKNLQSCLAEHQDVIIGGQDWLSMILKELFNRIYCVPIFSETSGLNVRCSYILVPYVSELLERSLLPG